MRALVEQGVVIVSGLALGCDSVAHEKALELILLNVFLGVESETYRYTIATIYT